MNDAPDAAPTAGSAPGAVPLVSVLIVSWNCRDDVLRCLESLARQELEGEMEVILVDNASTDGTVEAIRHRHPAVTVIENRVNVGFPRANNQALAVASGRYVLFLNPDTEVGKGTLAACLNTLEAEPDVGMVGCRLVYPDGTTQYEGARRPYRLGDLVFQSLYLHMLFPRHPLFARQLMGDWDHRGERDVEAIMGAFMLVRRSVAEGVGGLPDEVFMYHEDLAFCLRVRRAGWRIRYRGDVTTVHHSGRSSARSSARLYLLEGEYKTRLIREYQGPVYGLLARAVIAGRSLLRLGIATVGLLPGLGRLRRRYPRVFHPERHLLQLVWSVAPWAVSHLVPRTPTGPPDGSQTEAPR